AGERDESGREAAAHAGPQTVEQLVRVGDLEPQVQQAPTNPAPPPQPPRPPPPSPVASFQETRAFQAPDEGAEILGRKRSAELLLRPLPDHLERRFAVALLRDELLGLAKPKKPAGERVLDDHKGRPGRPLLADGQIAAEAWYCRNHGAARITKKAAGSAPTAFLVT